MIDLRRIPVVRVLVPFAGGILAGTHITCFPDPVWMIVISLVLWLIQLCCYFLYARMPRIQGLPFSLLSAGLVFWTGMTAAVLDWPDDPHLPSGVTVVIQGDLYDGPVERNGRLVYDMDVRMVAGRDSILRVRSTVKVYLEMPADSIIPAPGEIWRFCGRLVSIQNNGNPGEVDYASIMNRKNCWYRFFCDTLPGPAEKITALKRRSFSAVRIREAVSGKWEGSPEAVSLLHAVCLGDRSGLDEEMRQTYSRAGGMHILAVSGLHVGLIWWFLDRVLFFITRIFRRECYRALLVTLMIWFYAYVTGFSSPVSRSVTMFTFFSLARVAQLRGHPLNALLASAFLLIIIRPWRILDAGFQLSYLAVLAIVTIYPVLRTLIRVRHPLLKWLWEATCVSIAAQAGTLPLVVHYFHQVPLYSLFTNLLTVPLLSVIMTLFVISVPVAFIWTGAGPVIRLMVVLSEMMNRVMEFVSSVPGSVIGHLFLDPVCLALALSVFFLVILILNARSRWPFFILMLAVSMILVHSATARFSCARSRQFMIAHFNGGSMVTFRQGFFVDHYIWCRDPGNVAYMDRYLEIAWGRRCYESSVIWINGSVKLENAEGESVTDKLSGSISTCYSIVPGIWLVGNNGQNCLVVAGSLHTGQAGAVPGQGAFPGQGVVPGTGVLSGLKTDCCLVSGEPPVSPGLQSFLSSFGGKVIADGSNREWYTGRVEGLCSQIHITGKRGAYLEPV
jgi:competence protein ComEC